MKSGEDPEVVLCNDENGGRKCFCPGSSLKNGISDYCNHDLNTNIENSTLPVHNCIGCCSKRCNKMGKKVAICEGPNASHCTCKDEPNDFKTALTLECPSLSKGTIMNNFCVSCCYSECQKSGHNPEVVLCNTEPEGARKCYCPASSLNDGVPEYCNHDLTTDLRSSVIVAANCIQCCSKRCHKMGKKTAVCGGPNSAHCSCLD